MKGGEYGGMDVPKEMIIKDSVVCKYLKNMFKYVGTCMFSSSNMFGYLHVFFCKCVNISTTRDRILTCPFDLWTSLTISEVPEDGDV